MQFKFKKPHGKSNIDLNTLIFAKEDKIFEFNYEKETLKDIVTFDFPLNRQP